MTAGELDVRNRIAGNRAAMAGINDPGYNSSWSFFGGA
jgi:hypothetical protein